MRLHTQRDALIGPEISSAVLGTLRQAIWWSTGPPQLAGQGINRFGNRHRAMQRSNVSSLKSGPGSVSASTGYIEIDDGSLCDPFCLREIIFCDFKFS
jgi:hypothetical protein